MRRLHFETDHLVARPLESGDFYACRWTRDESVLTPKQAHGRVLTLGHDAIAAFSELLDRRRLWMARDQHYVMGVFLKESGRFVGDTLLFDVDRERRRAEIGQVIYSRFQGHGLGPECISATVAWGLEELGLDEVYGHIEDDNAPSTIACLTAGFELLTSAPVTRRFEGALRRGWPIAVRRTR